MVLLDSLIFYTAIVYFTTWVILEWVALFTSISLCRKCVTFWSVMAGVALISFDPVVSIGAASISAYIAAHHE